MTDTQLHASHPKALARLKRASGHLRSVIDMLENEQPCVDIAQQLHAVEKAIVNAKRALIHDHIDHCLESEGQVPDMVEFREIARYL